MSLAWAWESLLWCLLWFLLWVLEANRVLSVKPTGPVTMPTRRRRGQDTPPCRIKRICAQRRASSSTPCGRSPARNRRSA
ncbi:hypothetical protein CITRIK5_30208 [Citricoccus sp. K5]|nr:hypothetical protein CITRIK5_30208 [Citricoccus sp. K5]